VIHSFATKGMVRYREVVGTGFFAVGPSFVLQTFNTVLVLKVLVPSARSELAQTKRTRVLSFMVRKDACRCDLQAKRAGEDLENVRLCMHLNTAVYHTPVRVPVFSTSLALLYLQSLPCLVIRQQATARNGSCSVRFSSMWHISVHNGHHLQPQSCALAQPF